MFENLYECKICNAKFPNLSQILRHITISHIGKNATLKRRLDEFSFSCIIYHGEGGIRLEDGYFNGSKFKCYQCEESFENATALRKHRVSKHPRHKYRSHKCTKCQKNFGRDFLAFYNHEEIHHEIFRRNFCHLCDKRFTTASNLQRHLREEHKSDPFEGRFECIKCLKKYKSCKWLLKHKCKKAKNTQMDENYRIIKELTVPKENRIENLTLCKDEKSIEKLTLCNDEKSIEKLTVCKNGLEEIIEELILPDEFTEELDSIQLISEEELKFTLQESNEISFQCSQCDKSFGDDFLDFYNHEMKYHPM